MLRPGLVAALVLAAAAPLAAGGCRGGRDATLGEGGLGGPVNPDANPFPTLDAGSAGYALTFDGMQDYATAANASFAAAGAAQTIEMWIKPTSVNPSAYADLFVARLDTSSGLQIGFHNGALAVWRVYVDRVLVQAPSLPPVNVWHHVAYTYDTRTGLSTLYVDGAAVDSQANETDGRTPTSVWLGSFDGSGRLYSGLMDEVRVWNVTRTAAQVAADRAHTAPGAVPGLVAYWTFDDTTSGGRVLDASGNGNTMTLGDGVAERMPARVVSDAPVAP
ncbi:MAG TPA: LamG domain-containing protein [Polyangia bacterium]|nr:LamG domain-containing protein [Polyangia bacterium]